MSIQCIRAAIEEVRKLDAEDPDRPMIEAALESILARKGINAEQKLKLAQRQMGEMNNAAKRKAVSDAMTKNKMDLLEIETDGFSPERFNKFQDIVKSNNDPTRAVEAVSIESRKLNLTARYMQKLNQTFDDYFIGVFNVRPKDTINLSRELLGVNTGDPIARAARDNIRQVFDELMSRLRKAGVFVDKLPDHHPQRLSPGKVGTNKQEFLKDAERVLDIDNHVDPLATAEAYYKTLMTRHTLEPGDQPLTMGRKIHYRKDDPDAVIAFLQKYGEDDVIRQIERQVRSMTRALASAEALGPDPGRIVKMALQRFTTNAAEARNTKVQSEARITQAAWDQISGTADTPVNVSQANVMSGTRHLMIGMMLGKVGLAIATQDSWIAPLQRARAVGYGRSFSLQAQGMMAMLSSSMRNRLRDYYATIEPAFWMGSPNSRFSPEPQAEGFAGMAKKIGTGFYRAGGGWDAEQALRGASSFSMGKALGYAYRTPWEDLDPRLQQDFSSGGITPEVWAQVNQTGRIDGSGLFLWDQMPTDAGEVMGAWFHKTLNQTVLRPDATTQALLMFGGRRGTLPGELALSVTQFLTWPVAFARTSMYHQMKAGAPAFAVFGGSMVAAAAVTEQLYQISGGRPAYEWDSPHLWGGALARSGLLTPIGDWAWAYATGDQMRQPTLGPIVDTAGNILVSGGRTVRDVIDGDTDAAAAELIRLTGRLAPNTFWFEMTIIKPAVKSAMESLDPSYLANQESRYFDEGRMGY